MFELGFGRRREMHQRRGRPRSRPDGGTLEQGRHRADEPQRLRKHQFTAAVHAPVVADVDGLQPFAAGGTPERQRLEDRDTRARLGMEMQPAPVVTTVVKESLLRQPLEGRAVCDRQAAIEARQPAVRAVDTLGGRGRDRKVRACTDLDRRRRRARPRD
jgi:hypothetical protein